MIQPYDERNGVVLYQGDCRDVLAALPEQSAQMICCSPPYWMARTYTDDPREIGQEPTPPAYVEALVEVFTACWRVLRDDGTLWLNIGDRYSSSSTYNAPRSMHTENGWKQVGRSPNANTKATGLPPKSLIGLPWRLAFALQDAGWVLRNEIIWWKRNSQPESVRDRCGRDHEPLFLFAKSPRYYFHAAAIATPAANAGKVVKLGEKSFSRGQARGAGVAPSGNGKADTYTVPDLRNPRTVWDIPTAGIADEHYAPMPQALAERCILAGSRPGDVVLDPFAGSGTTGRAALALQRRAILIDLAYTEMQQRRTDKVQVRMEL